MVDSIETRVAVLEERIRGLAADLGEIRTDIERRDAGYRNRLHELENWERAARGQAQLARETTAMAREAQKAMLTKRQKLVALVAVLITMVGTVSSIVFGALNYSHPPPASPSPASSTVPQVAP